MLYQGTCISCVEEEGGAEGSVAEAYHPRAATGRWGPFSGTESKARVLLLFAWLAVSPMGFACSPLTLLSVRAWLCAGGQRRVQILQALSKLGVREEKADLA